MEKSQVESMFIDILVSSPGVLRICKDPKTDKFKVKAEYTNRRWTLQASIIILKNANVKNIMKSIGALSNYTFAKSKVKYKKLEIVIEGIENE
ncbi:hypothetical protein [Mycoplasmopsis columbinasalis]|uniref:Uncharacterized protein n=1 Tax=Mycoplasmopsis columbinasalis TaxID=114880 RepID=A0A449BA59_9BACT|nr:hypothetical protein [Mycoplasmopsis columbinasalis]VEU78065.1 Uncharacterised protein [Mycoplasmopsis columbinasalis]